MADNVMLLMDSSFWKQNKPKKEVDLKEQQQYKSHYILTFVFNIYCLIVLVLNMHFTLYNTFIHNTCKFILLYLHIYVYSYV